MQDQIRRLAAVLDVHPSEVVGLAVLLAGGIAVTLGLTLAPRVAGPIPERGGPVVLADASPATTSLTVHVAGAVRQPGVVVLPAGARVGGAIEAAGGARPDAALDGLNLAALLEDGQQVLVPSTVGTSAPDGTAPATSPPGDGRLDLNAATAAQLEELPGIGPVLAERIVAWREEHGRFEHVGDLREVPGVGERTFQNLADLIRV